MKRTQVITNLSNHDMRPPSQRQASELFGLVRGNDGCIRLMKLNKPPSNDQPFFQAAGPLQLPHIDLNEKPFQHSQPTRLIENTINNSPINVAVLPRVETKRRITVTSRVFQQPKAKLIGPQVPPQLYESQVKSKNLIKDETVKIHPLAVDATLETLATIEDQVI